MSNQDRQDGDGLLPCPFCGGPAVNVGALYITCGAPWNGNCAGRKTRCVKEQWNTRAIPQPTRDAAGAEKVCPYCNYPVGNCPGCGRATPQPAPDAMRRPLDSLLEVAIHAESNGESASKDDKQTWAAHARKVREAVAEISVALSAPEPSPDGAGETRFVTKEDREYASELLADLTSDDLPRLEIAARWFRKARVERSISSATGAAEPGIEGIRWQRVNSEPFEYAIQQGPCGDTFVKLLNGLCLRRATPPVRGDREAIARIIAGDIFGSPDSSVGPATLAARKGALAKADAILSLRVQPGAGERDPSLGLPKSQLAKYKTSAELDAENTSRQAPQSSREG